MRKKNIRISRGDLWQPNDKKYRSVSSNRRTLPWRHRRNRKTQPLNKPAKVMEMVIRTRHREWRRDSAGSASASASPNYYLRVASQKSPACLENILARSGCSDFGKLP